MAKVTVKIDAMSWEEAKAWVHAVADLYGSDLVMECLKERERRFEIASERLPDIENEINAA